MKSKQVERIATVEEINTCEKLRDVIGELLQEYNLTIE
jgi:hypothetical protein